MPPHLPVVGRLARFLRSPRATLDARRRRRIDQVCRGFSGEKHWRFFDRLVRERKPVDLLVLGVYFGRDVAYLARLMGLYERRRFSITGVDRFEDSACADWPESARGLTWEEAGYGPAPNLGAVEQNLRRLRLDRNVELRCAHAEQFLESTARTFDFIYIDTSHDYATTIRTISLAIPRLRPYGTVAGDDFSDQETWGVASAVRASFLDFDLFEGWIWSARPESVCGAPPSRGNT